MSFLTLYGRVLGLLKPERNLAILLAVANLALAGLQFFEPMLFGRVIDTLSNAVHQTPGEVWHNAFRLLGFWALVGLGGIGANILVALHSDRMAHRRRLAVMADY